MMMLSLIYWYILTFGGAWLSLRTKTAKALWAIVGDCLYPWSSLLKIHCTPFQMKVNQALLCSWSGITKPIYFPSRIALYEWGTPWSWVTSSSIFGTAVVKGSVLASLFSPNLIPPCLWASNQQLITISVPVFLPNWWKFGKLSISELHCEWAVEVICPVSKSAVTSGVQFHAAAENCIVAH